MKSISGIALLAGVAAGSLLPMSVAAKAPALKVVSAIGAPAARCASLAGLKLADTSITSAVLVPGKEAETSIAGDAAGYRSFCRVVAHVRAAPGSDIGVEIWLPVEGWAGVFHGNGNGGFAGILASGYSGMADACGAALRPRRPTPVRRRRPRSRAMHLSGRTANGATGDGSRPM